MTLDLKKIIEQTDEERVKQLFKVYGQQLFAYANSNWKVGEDASWDIVYKTIYKLSKVINTHHFEVEQQLKSFLFKMLINYLKNYLRDERTKKGGHQEVDLNDNIPSSAETKNVNPAIGKLNKALDELEEWQRILLLMRAQGFSYSEIAKYTDKPVKHLKVYYGRLKKQLEKKIMLNEKIEVHGK